MLEIWEKDRFMEKVFNVALKEIFSQFYRKYDHPIVFEVWAEIMRKRGSNDNLAKWMWSPQRTIQEELDSLQSFSDLIESIIQQREKKKSKKDQPE